MSTLRVSTLQDTAGSNGSTPSEVFNGRSKLWVRFNGTGTVAIDRSYNVSSITDFGTGDYGVNYSITVPTTGYVAMTACDDVGVPYNNTSSLFNANCRQGTIAATSVRIIVSGVNPGSYRSPIDSTAVFLAVFH